MVAYVCLNDKALKSVKVFLLNNMTQLIIMSIIEKNPRQEVGGGYTVVKHYYAWNPTAIEHIDIVEKNNTFMNINCGT